MILKTLFIGIKNLFIEQDVATERFSKLIHSKVREHQRKLCLHVTEERFDPGIVEAVAGTRHTLDNAVLLQEGRILPASKLASLV